MASSKPKLRYIDTLDTAARSRYEQNITLIGVDQYKVKKDSLTSDLDSLLAISNYDIVNQGQKGPKPERPIPERPIPERPKMI